ncbi:MAG: hypothetical protein NVSMB9_01890 [Isosphaeraceae bacterium]
MIVPKVARPLCLTIPALILTLLAGAAQNPPRTSSSPDASGSEKYEAVTRTGKFVMLSEALKSFPLVFDAGPVVKQVVLKGDDGRITPLFSDEASRALFLDERLRGRKSEVKGRLYSGVPYLQIVSYKIEDEGALRTPEYYCEICTIHVRFPQICPCCQGEMVLRMKP